MVGNNAIVYQGLQRVFRNAIVDFLRTHLRRLFGRDASNQVKRIFGDNWEKAAADASKSRDSGGTTTVLADEFDLLGVNHFFDIFERHFDRIFSAPNSFPSDFAKPNKSKLLGNLKVIKDARDPLSHPVNQEIPYDEAFGILIDCRQVLSALGLRIDEQEVSRLCETLVGGRQMISVVRTLPTQDSIYLTFVGRELLLRDLENCFGDHDNRRAVLAGDGGKGKSALAYRFAQSFSHQTSRFQLIVWASAKQRKFEAGKTVSIGSPDFWNTETAIKKLLAQYGALEEDFLLPIAHQKRLLLDFLEAYPAFIIADDIDSLFDDTDVISLFTHEIPHTRSAVLLTSRRDIPGIRSFIVKGFEPDEVQAFLRSRAELYGLPSEQFTTTTISSIATATDSSPLYMEELMRLARVLGVNEAVRAWMRNGGDEARKYALQREMEKLSTDAKKVLVAAAISDGSVSAAELENLLELSEDRLIASLSELNTLFLFAKPKIVEGEQRFEINSNTRKLVQQVEGGSDFYARLERKSKALRGQLPEIGHGVVGALIRQAQLRLNAQQNPEAEKILLGAIDKYPQSADLHSFLGYAYKRMGRVVDARKSFESAYKLKSLRREHYIQWLRMEIAEKEWSKAIATAEKALRLIPDFPEMLERRVYAERQAGFDFHAGLHREKAERMWRDAVEHAEAALKQPDLLEAGERQTNALLYCSAVVCLDMLREYKRRDELVDRWASEHPDDPELQRQCEFLNRKYGVAYSR